MTSKWKEKQQGKLLPSLLSESLWAVWFLSASLVRFYHIYLRQLGPAGPAFFLSVLKACTTVRSGFHVCMKAVALAASYIFSSLLRDFFIADSVSSFTFQPGVSHRLRDSPSSL